VIAQWLGVPARPRLPLIEARGHAAEAAPSPSPTAPPASSPAVPVQAPAPTPAISTATSAGPGPEWRGARCQPGLPRTGATGGGAAARGGRGCRRHLPGGPVRPGHLRGGHPQFWLSGAGQRLKGHADGPACAGSNRHTQPSSTVSVNIRYVDRPFNRACLSTPMASPCRGHGPFRGQSLMIVFGVGASTCGSKCNLQPIQRGRRHHRPGRDTNRRCRRAGRCCWRLCRLRVSPFEAGAVGPDAVQDDGDLLRDGNLRLLGQN